MHWITASLLMFLSSVALYLCVRKSNSLRTPQQLNNLAMFLVPLVVYLVLAVNSSTSFSLKPYEYALILIQGIFFSYLGNLFSLRGIEAAPNPGYSLIISKSYVVFTAIASIFLFASPLTGKSILAIALIVVCSAIITINKNTHNSHTSATWLPYTMGAYFCWSFLALSSKYLLNVGVPILTRLVLSFVVTTVLIIGEIQYKKVAWKTISRDQLIILLLIGIFGASFNYYMQVGFNLAPNVGFVNATNAASISLLTLLSTYFFKDELTARKLVGILGVTGGLLLLFL